MKALTVACTSTVACFIWAKLKKANANFYISDNLAFCKNKIVWNTLFSTKNRHLADQKKNQYFWSCSRSFMLLPHPSLISSEFNNFFFLVASPFHSPVLPRQILVFVKHYRLLYLDKLTIDEKITNLDETLSGIWSISLHYGNWLAFPHVTMISLFWFGVLEFIYLLTTPPSCYSFQFSKNENM